MSVESAFSRAIDALRAIGSEAADELAATMTLDPGAEIDALKAAIDCRTEVAFSYGADRLGQLPAIAARARALEAKWDVAIDALCLLRLAIRAHAPTSQVATSEEIDHLRTWQKERELPNYVAGPYDQRCKKESNQPLDRCRRIWDHAEHGLPCKFAEETQ